MIAFTIDNSIALEALILFATTDKVVDIFFYAIIWRLSGMRLLMKGLAFGFEWERKWFVYGAGIAYSLF